MKKILAILLVVMLLGTTTAFAENASIYSLSDPVVSITADGQPMTLDLTGLSIGFAPLTIDDLPTIVLTISANDQVLMSGAAQLNGNTVLMTAEGLSRTYSAQLPENLDVSGTISNFDPSMLDLSTIDVDAMMSMIMENSQFDVNGNTTTITVPYVVINEVLAQFAPLLESINVEGVDMSEVTQAFAQLKESDSGVTLVIAMTEEENGGNVVVDVYPVENGETAPESLVNVAVVMADVFTFDLSAAGQITMHFSFDPATGAVEITFDVPDAGFGLAGVVGATEGEVAVPAIDAANALDVTTLSDEDMELLQNEFIQASSGLIGALYPALAQSGLMG